MLKNNQKRKKNLLIVLGAILSVLIASVLFFGMLRFLGVRFDTSEIGNRSVFTQGVSFSSGAELKKVGVVYADSEAASRGLSDIKKLNDQEGMIFVYLEPTVPAFWMKDMKMDIDIIWINCDATVQGIEPNVSPSTYPQKFSPSSEVQFVLETRAGWANDNNVQVGDRVDFSTDSRGGTWFGCTKAAAL